MKNRKLFLIFLILITIFSSVFFVGHTFRENTVSLYVIHEEKPVFEKKFPLSFSSSFSLFLLYGNDLKKMYEKRFLGNPKALFDYLNPEIYAELQSVSKKLDFPPSNAEASFDKKGNFTYTEEKKGFKTDIEKTLLNAIYSYPSELSFEVPSPSVTVSDLKDKTVKIASFTTDYHNSSYSRKKNVSLAASRLDGLKIMPGDKLSFNETVGKRTIENGFTEATVIKNGEYTSGVGGGVCQVSTTLYNAWLYTGQTVVTSRSHSLVPSYVTPGLDAMVSDMGDLVLQNYSLSPLYIDSDCDGNVLTFTIYGEKPFCLIELSSELVKTTPYDVYEYVIGEEDAILCEPKPGKTYRSYRIYKDKYGFSEKEFLRISDYLPQKGKKSLKKENKTPSDNANLQYKEQEENYET